MEDRYSKFGRFLPQLNLWHVQELRVNDEEDEDIDPGINILGDLNSVMKALPPHDVGLPNAPVLFNGVMKKNTSTPSCLEKRSHLVGNVAFENAVCKVPRIEEHSLTAAEHKSLRHLLKLQRSLDADTTSQTTCSSLLDY